MRLPIVAIFMKTRSRLLFLFIVLFVNYSCNSFIGKGKKKPPKSTFKILEKEIEKGDNAILTWFAEEADTIRIEGVIDNAKPIDTLVLKPDTTTSYTMYIVRPGGVKKRRQTVKVYMPKASSVEAPDSVSDEDDILLKWRTRDALYASFDGLYDSLSRSGQMTIKRDTTTRFILRAHGEFNTDTVSTETEVTLIEEIEAPPKIYKGQKVPITWKLKRTDSVTVKGFDETFNACDTVYVKPNDTRSYSIVAHKVYGRDKYYDRIIFVMPPRINFSGSSTIIKGETGNVFWQVMGGDSVFLGKELKPVKTRGSIKISPQTDTTLFLSVFSDGKRLEREFTMFVMNDRRFFQKIKPVTALKVGERIDLDILHWEYESFNNNLLINFVIVDTAGNYITKAMPKGGSKKIINKLALKHPENVESPTMLIDENDPDKQIRNNITVLGDMSTTTPDEGRILHHAMLDIFKAKSDNDSLILALFNKKINTRFSFVSDTLFLDAVFSSYFDSIAEGRNYFQAIDTYLKNGFQEQGKEVLVLFTSGRDNSSFMPCNTIDVDAMLSELIQHKVKVFIVNYGENHDLPILKTISDATGGKFYQVNRKYDVVLAFKEISLGLQYFYTASVYPENTSDITINIDYNNRTSGKTKLDHRILLQPPSLKGMLLDTSLYWNNSNMDVLSPPQALVFFESNSSVVSDKYENNMNRVVKCLEDNPDLKMKLIGHSDLTGPVGQCEQIAEERAENVQKVLVDMGISEERIILSSFGKDFPEWADETEAVKAYENRRVDLVWVQ